MPRPRRFPLPPWLVLIVFTLVVLSFPLSTSAQPTDDLGTRWDEQEGGATGAWTRRGASNVFDAVWSVQG